MSKRKLIYFVIVLLAILSLSAIVIDVQFSKKIEKIIDITEQNEEINVLTEQWENIKLERKTDAVFGGIILILVLGIVLKTGPQRVNTERITQEEAQKIASELEKNYREQGIFVLPSEMPGENIPTSLETPVLINATFVENKVVVKWQSVKYAEGYSVWRRTGTQSWSRVGRVKDGRCEYYDYNIESKTRYSYTVRAYVFVDGMRIISHRDPIGVDADVVQGNIPEIPKLYKTVDSCNRECIAWEKIENADSYRIMRKKNNEEWEIFANVTAEKPLKYYDESIKANSDYFYAVSAVRRFGGQEIYSEYDEDGLKL